jgi:hypothetical protein
LVQSAVVPHHLAGLGVEADQMGVRRGDDQGAFIDRHVARREVDRVGDQLCRQLALVFPDEIAVGGVEGLDAVGVVEDEEHAVVDDRGGLGGARDHRPGPGDLEVLDVALVDLLERAVAVAVKGAPPHQPIGRRRIAQHGVGDGREVAGGIGGLLGERRSAGEQQRRQRKDRRFPISMYRHGFLPLLGVWRHYSASPDNSDPVRRLSVLAAPARPLRQPQSLIGFARPTEVCP